MHRVTPFILLMLMSVSKVSAIEESQGAQCQQSGREAYFSLLGELAGEPGNHPDEQCFYDSFPIFRGDVSAEELIVREIPSPPENKQAMTGICFSGGGSRSLSLTRGQLAALFYLGYESNINYISMISGGAWGAANYYALPEHIRAHYLGNLVEDIASLYWGGADDADDRNIAWLHPYSIGRAPQRMSFSDVAGHFVANFYTSGPKLWSDYLERVLLTPYGLDAKSSLREPLFSAKPDHMQLIVSAGVKNASSHLVPVEITPVSIGARVPVDRGEAYALPPGGFGRQALGMTANYLWVDPGSGFTLGDMHAVTSSNFVHMAPAFWDAMSVLGFGAPGFNWLSLNFTNGQISQSYRQVVDSGPDEYLGLMPLLARGMRRVIAFVNTDIPIVKGKDVIGLEKALPSYFGIIPDQLGSGSDYHIAVPEMTAGCKPYCLRSQVFPHNRFKELAEHLWQAKENGQPIVYLQKNLPLLNNAAYGVKGGGLVDILWVYNDLPNGWMKRLSAQLQDKIASDDQFVCSSGVCQPNGYHFPHYYAMSELKLSREQVNMLFHLSAWTVFGSRELLESLFEQE